MKKNNKAGNKKNIGGSNVKRVLLAIAIAVIFSFFIGYGITTVYKEPSECKDDDLYEPYPRNINYSLCNKTRSLNVSECYDRGGSPVYDRDENGCRVFDRCDMCNARYEKTIFFAYITIGVIAVVIGALVLQVSSVASGIMGGGILLMIYSTMRYWGLLQDYLRLIILGIVLVILLWLGIKKIR